MLSTEELRVSEIVANATMNRGRGLSGVNSYQRELRLDILSHLKDRAAKQGFAVWYDACCGEARALAEAIDALAGTEWEGKIRIFGVDLIEALPRSRRNDVRLIAGDVTAFTPDEPVDLITCVHGLHYLGDKIGYLERAYRQLASGGLLIGNLDKENIQQEDGTPALWGKLVRRVRKQGVDLRFDDHILRIRRTDIPLDFGLTYAGATISKRPNYTGITVIDSWYAHHAVL